MRFIAYLADAGLGYTSIRAYLSGLRFCQIALGLPDPNLPGAPLLHYVLRGVHRSQSLVVGRRLPITPEIMQLLFTAWASPGVGCFYDRSMLWAACCLGFLRSGEFTCSPLSAFGDHMLSPRDVQVDSHMNPSLVRVILRRSKTDPYAVGVPIHLGRTGHRICPVSALLGFLALRGNKHGPLFTFRDGSCLSRQRLVSEVRVALQSQGVDPAYLSAVSGHSFRIGAATAAAHVRMEDSLIQMLGRWRSSTFLRYVRTPGQDLAAASVQLIDSIR